MTLITFDTIAGARVYFPPNGLKPRKVRLERAFHAKMEACLSDLWQRCLWGPAQWIGSLGCYVVDAKRDTGRHKTGEAIDVSDLLWPDGGPGSSISSDDPGLLSRGEGPKRMARYLAVEAVFRLHFQTVLDWWHPDADGGFRHRDHWHIDTGRGEPTWEGRSNQVRFLQAALRYVWQCEGEKGPLNIDGKFGKETFKALSRCDTVEFVARDPLSPKMELTLRDDWWQRFLEAAVQKGFAS